MSSPNRPSGFLVTRQEVIDAMGGKISDGLLRASAETFHGLAQEVLDEYKQKESQSMQGWHQLLPNVRDLDSALAPIAQAAYANTVIKSERITRLLDPDEKVRSMARVDLEKNAGFLHEKPPQMQQYFPPSGTTKVLHDSQGEMRGIYTLLTDPACVSAECKRQFSWEPGKTYTTDNLPQSSSVGALTWTNKHAGAYALNLVSQGKLVLPGDLVILQQEDEGLPYRNMGAAQALKVGAYRELPLDASTITSIYEIVDVNDQPILPSTVRNRWSRRMNENLGAMTIGTLYEQFQRSDGTKIGVNWNLYFSSVQDLLEKAQLPKAA